MTARKMKSKAAEKQPAAGSKQDVLVLRFRETDTPMGVTRETTRRLAEHYGITETGLIHIALRGLANDVWPIDELDASYAELDRRHVQKRPRSR